MDLILAVEAYLRTRNSGDAHSRQGMNTEEADESGDAGSADDESFLDDAEAAEDEDEAH